MKSRILALVALCAAALWVPAQAADELDPIRAALNKLSPGKAPDSIVKAAMPGFYEVTYGSDIYYVSADARYLLAGTLMDLKDGKNLTEEKLGQARLKLISSVDSKNMIIFSPKKEKVKHRITVFTDIDCGYCRKLHQEIDEVNKLGIEVHYLFFPRAGAHSKSYDKAVSVWCSSNRQQALTDAKAGKPVPEKKCDNPVDEHMAIVEKLGLTGTPTMVLEDGTMVPGYIPAARLAALLDDKDK